MNARPDLHTVIQQVTDTGAVLYKPDETVALALSNPVNATIGANNPATLTIVDDDVPTVQFSASTYNASEAEGSASVVATLVEYQ